MAQNQLTHLTDIKRPYFLRVPLLRLVFWGWTREAKYRQLIRRGRPYREVVQGQKEEGMFFVALNASLRRQFEFIQHSWLNNPKFGGQYDSRDPITGLPRFVHVRGGAYFFLPGIRALRFLASLSP
ncbi:Dyp-type peroxidase domain-containing protein [Archangium lansingense]|uniref:Dyp-type peroxidase n=1 Tax=Archangium lansingense TaxID=2995310 RepID=A0ABT4A613_9BACT|nr:Dyp-type peroxidase domain-containing protein [Archangium lansinium]MCY1077084.1 Dyp-type peroxidase [Archangium lansinium]